MTNMRESNAVVSPQKTADAAATSPWWPAKSLNQNCDLLTCAAAKQEYRNKVGMGSHALYRNECTRSLVQHCKRLNTVLLLLTTSILALTARHHCKQLHVRDSGSAELCSTHTSFAACISFYFWPTSFHSIYVHLVLACPPQQ